MKLVKLLIDMTLYSEGKRYPKRLQKGTRGYLTEENGSWLFHAPNRRIYDVPVLMHQVQECDVKRLDIRG